MLRWMKYTRFHSKIKTEKWRYTFEIIDVSDTSFAQRFGRCAGYGTISMASQTGNHVFRRYWQFAMRLWE